MSAWQHAHDDAISVDLSGRGLFAFEGPDARRFLNGMFTNNVTALEVGQANRHGMCDNRGRLIGLLDVWCTAPERFVAVLDGADPEAFEARYRRFIVFDDVELTDLSPELGLVTLQGPAAAGRGAALELSRPRDRSGLGGIDVLVALDRVPEVMATCEPASTADLELLRIAAGLPVFPADVDERAGPHVMGLLDELVSFDKGCYVGQETICRIDSLGTVKRRFSQLLVEGDAAPAVGSDIESAGKRVGVVSSAAVVPGLGAVALGIVKASALQTDLVIDSRPAKVRE